MRATIAIGVVLAGALLAGAVPTAAQGRKLSDAELDKVSAGGSSDKNAKEVAAFHFQGQAGSSHWVEGSGTVLLKEGALPLTTSRLFLGNNAQQNLQSLVNIVAVNSKVQVLVNLNVSINSTVGAVQQANSSLGH